MNDEQCMVIVNAIKDLTNATNLVAEKIEEIYSYNDRKLVEKIGFIVEILEEIKDFKL